MFADVVKGPAFVRNCPRWRAIYLFSFALASQTGSRYVSPWSWQFTSWSTDSPLGRPQNHIPYVSCAAFPAPTCLVSFNRSRLTSVSYRREHLEAMRDYIKGVLQRCIMRTGNQISKGRTALGQGRRHLCTAVHTHAVRVQGRCSGPSMHRVVQEVGRNRHP